MQVIKIWFEHVNMISAVQSPNSNEIFFCKRWKKSINMERNQSANDFIRRHEYEYDTMLNWIASENFEFCTWSSPKCQMPKFQDKIKFLLYYIAWNEGNKHLIGTWCEYAFCSTISQFQWNLLRGKMDQKNITWNHLLRTFLL